MKDCPYCKNKNCYEMWKESEYENSNDPTPEYGGKLIEVEIEHCGHCECVGSFNNVVKGAK